MPRTRLLAAAFGRNCTLPATEPGALLQLTHIPGSDMPRVLDWRSAAAYAYVDDLNPAELAWEFLRRNSDYQRDFRAAARDAAGPAGFSQQGVLRRGLPFPHRSRSAGG